MDGYLYVNSQGEIEVRDISSKNIVNIWSGYSEQCKKVNITDYVNKKTNIKLLIYGLYEDSYRSNDNDLIYDRTFYNDYSYPQHYYRPTFGLPSAFHTFINGYDDIYFNDTINTLIFKRDSDYFVNSSSGVLDKNYITKSRTSNLNFCELINIYIPFNDTNAQTMYSNHYSTSRSNDQKTILTGKRLNNHVNDIYTRDLPYVHYINGNDDILDVSLSIESGTYLLTLGTFNLKTNTFYENGNFLSNQSMEIESNLVITGVSLILD